MKLKITDIYSGFQDKFFDIPVDNLPSRGTIFSDHFIKCNLSVEENQKGFEMIGKLITAIECVCVRCLVKISYLLHCRFKLFYPIIRKFHLIKVT